MCPQPGTRDQRGAGAARWWFDRTSLRGKTLANRRWGLLTAMVCAPHAVCCGTLVTPTAEHDLELLHFPGGTQRPTDGTDLTKMVLCAHFVRQDNAECCIYRCRFDGFKQVEI